MQLGRTSVQHRNRQTRQLSTLKPASGCFRPVQEVLIILEMGVRVADLSEVLAFQVDVHKGRPSAQKASVCPSHCSKSCHGTANEEPATRRIVGVLFHTFQSLRTRPMTLRRFGAMYSALRLRVVASMT